METRASPWEALETKVLPSGERVYTRTSVLLAIGAPLTKTPHIEAGRVVRLKAGRGFGTYSVYCYDATAVLDLAMQYSDTPWHLWRQALC